jgi:hypothetical protein
MHKLYRQRTTDRHGKPVGTFSNNQGYLAVKHDPVTGRFISK